MILLFLLITENRLEIRKIYSPKSVRTAEGLYIPNYLCVFMKYGITLGVVPGNIQVAQIFSLC